ncbi:expressed unknown protein [Seminavis robusta]|uniref:Uncharacterized protein n=1 Tax=Seminavis robusta TaxID=568900 RepID=A0A9N8HY48_9STRA|nr:expressed unknown protein [Seminavis robusta]|eukprot:Sro2699_g335010.1 n/a (274) ;mRNA; f:6422-7243
MRTSLLTLALISLSSSTISGAHADSVRRSLKGLVFNGAPGKYVGRGSAPHDQETTEATLVGHLTENNTAVLDVTPPPSDLPASAETTAGVPVSNPPPSSPTDNEEEFRQEEEKELKEEEEDSILAALLGSFMGSFTAVAIFMALAYRLMVQKFEAANITNKHVEEVDVDTVDFSSASHKGFEEDLTDVTLEQTTTHATSNNRFVTTTTRWDEYMPPSNGSGTFSPNSSGRFSFVASNSVSTDVEEADGADQLTDWSEPGPRQQWKGDKCLVIV